MNDAVVGDIVDAVARTRGPIVEIGAGSGSLTVPISRLGRSLTAVEIDSRLARQLRSRAGATVDVVCTDFLSYRLPERPHVLVGNLPFHLTTALLRRIFNAPGWTEAVLLVQWEVARRRAGVGGSSMMTAQWAPWFEFTLGRRVPASAFRPRPAVDGGVITMTRRRAPLVPWAGRREYQALVHDVFTGAGRGLPEVLTNAGLFAGRAQARHYLRRHQRADATLPKDLRVEEWVELFAHLRGQAGRSN